MLLMISMIKKIIGTFYPKELQKTNQKEFTIEKIIKIKGGKLYVKWKGADVFNARLAQANLVTKQILMLNYQVLTKGLLQIKQNTYLLKMN